MNFREMRRKRQQLTKERCIEILKNATSGTLALLGDNGYPYTVPISFVYSNGKLFFHSALSGHKIDAIRNHDKASFCVTERDDVQPEKFTTFFRSVIACGKIHIIESSSEKLKAAYTLGIKYNPNNEIGLHREIDKGFTHMLMICLDIEHLTGKEAIELIAGPSGNDC